MPEQLPILKYEIGFIGEHIAKLVKRQTLQPYIKEITHCLIFIIVQV
jgi:hypothetical protein